MVGLTCALCLRAPCIGAWILIFRVLLHDDHLYMCKGVVCHVQDVITYILQKPLLVPWHCRKDAPPLENPPAPCSCCAHACTRSRSVPRPTTDFVDNYNDDLGITSAPLLDVQNTRRKSEMYSKGYSGARLS